jgi:hypothetical protein
MKVEKNNNSIFRNKHVLIVVAVMCIFTIIACMGFMLSVPAHAEENIAPKTEPIAFSTPIETVNELDEAFPMMETSEKAQEEITTAGAEVEFSDAAEPEPQIETAEAAIEEPEPEAETIPDNLDDNELEIYTALRSAGLSKAGTAAVMGCMTMESGLNASAENPSDGGYGLLQWTYSRKSDLFNWCYAAGLDATSAEGQVAFLVYELQSTYSKAAKYSYPVYETLTTSDSLEDCLSMFFSHMEAGTNVAISSSKVYAGGLTTLNLYHERLTAAYKYF